jgi:hypothetical protein
MDYRDERDALRGRVENLEQELGEAKRELSRRADDGSRSARVARLEEQLADARRLLDDLGRELADAKREVRQQPQPMPAPVFGSAAAPRTSARTGIVPALIVAMLAGSVLCWRLLRTATPAGTPPPTPPPPSVEAPVQPAEAASVAEPPAPASPQIRTTAAAPRLARPRWRATVRRSEGLALAPGTACLIEATVEATGTNARVGDLELRCGIETLYTSTLSGYRTDIHDDVRERLTRRDEESTFTLQYGDEARNGNQTSKVDVDSTKGTVVVQRRIPLEWRVELTMPAESQPTAPLSGSGQRLRREGHVTKVSGAAIVSPGASCVLRAMPNGNGDACVAEVRCGAAVLFPTSAEVRCAYDGARPTSVVSTGEHPTLQFDGQRLDVQTASRAVVSLELD